MRMRSRRAFSSTDSWLLGPTQELGGRDQLAGLTGGHGQLVKGQRRLARGAAQEQDGAAVGRGSDRGGPAEDEAPGLGERAQEGGIGAGGGGGRGGEE
jgi:hypothetical protein